MLKMLVGVCEGKGEGEGKCEGKCEGEVVMVDEEGDLVEDVEKKRDICILGTEKAEGEKEKYITKASKKWYV